MPTLNVGNDVVATIGEANPLLTRNYDISQRILLAEINLDKIAKYARSNKKYAPITKFPAVERDISMLVDESVEVGKIEAIIQRNLRKMLSHHYLPYRSHHYFHCGAPGFNDFMLIGQSLHAFTSLMAD